MSARTTMPASLSIAGSDSGGGAGIQADLKAFQANGVFGMTVITSVTAQNTQAVTAAHDLPLELIEAQFRAVLDDIDVAAAKTGMLSSAAIVRTVSRLWRELPKRPPLVVDPVMVSKSGFALLSPDAVDMVKTELLPLATVITPNRHETELLTGVRLDSRSALDEAAHRLLALGPSAVLLKGGHLEDAALDPDRAVDYLYERGGSGASRSFSAERLESTNTHGTGCTFSAAIAAWLGRGASLVDAIERAKLYVTGAIRNGLAIGHGHGPTHHFWFLPQLNGGNGARTADIPNSVSKERP